MANNDNDSRSQLRDYEIRQRGYKRGNLLQRIYWQIVGWPTAKEVLHRWSDSPFSLAEEGRIREIVREEQDS